MNCLPNDLLLEIFDRLDDKSLITASQVCKRWREVIQQSPSTMKRFTLLITPYSAYGKIHNANYQNIVMKGVLKDNVILNMETAKFLEGNRKIVKNLTLMTFMFSDMISLFNGNNMENLINLTIVDCENNVNRVIRIVLPSLTHLELYYSTNFLNFINVHSVTNLKISNHDNYKKSLAPSICDDLNSFLKTCVDLRDFTLSNFNNDLTPLTLDIHKFKFNLVSLTAEDSIINNLQEFLVSQKNSLRNLAINSENHNDELIKTIFYELTLTELEIDVAIVSENYQLFTRNLTIKKLILRRIIDDEKDIRDQNELYRLRKSRGNIRHSDIPVFRDGIEIIPQQMGFVDHDMDDMDYHELYVERNQINMERQHRIEERQRRRASNQQNPSQKAEKIISICSAVEELSIHNFNLSTDGFLNSINITMPNLKILKLSTVPIVISEIDQFDNLTHLEIDSIDYPLDIENLILLVNYIPNLKIIKINNVRANILNVKYFTKIIKKAKYLEEFYIGSNFIFTSEMYEAVKNIKVLEYPLRNIMYTKCSHVQQGLHNATNIKIQNFKFSLCEEPQLIITPMVNNFKLGGMEGDAKEREETLQENSKYQLCKSNYDFYDY